MLLYFNVILQLKKSSIKLPPIRSYKEIIDINKDKKQEKFKKKIKKINLKKFLGAKRSAQAHDEILDRLTVISIC